MAKHPTMHGDARPHPGKDPPASHATGTEAEKPCPDAPRAAPRPGPGATTRPSSPPGARRRCSRLCRDSVHTHGGCNPLAGGGGLESLQCRPLLCVHVNIYRAAALRREGARPCSSGGDTRASAEARSRAAVAGGEETALRSLGRRVSASSAAVTKHYEPHGLKRQALACSLFRLAVWGPEIDTQVSAGPRSPCRCCGGPVLASPGCGDCGGPCRAAVSASVPHGRSPASVSLEGRSSLDVGPAWEIQGDLIPRSLPELHLQRADLFPSEAPFPGPADGPPRGPAALGRGPVFPGARLSPSLSPHPSVGAAGSEPAGPPTRGQHTALRALTPRGRR